MYNTYPIVYLINYVIANDSGYTRLLLMNTKCKIYRI